MFHTQFLIFEIGPGCNLAADHPLCPVSSGDRWASLDTSRALDTETIVRIAEEAYRDHGFRGLIGFHYYCEPLLYRERMAAVMAGISEVLPQAQFLLWTNGTKLEQQDVASFDAVVVTDYGVRDLTEFRSLPNVSIIPARFDARLDACPVNSVAPCSRMFAEFVIDCHGNVHLCCYDWHGLGSPGNVFTSDLGTLVRKWQAIRAAIIPPTMSDDAPDVCRSCPMRFAAVPQFLPGFAQRAKRYITARQRAGKAVGVVFPFFRMPQERLDAHFQWNGGLYQDAAEVLVVADRPYTVPDYATCLVYPEEMPVFSITKAKNHGIREALRRSCEVVVSTDADIAFSPRAWAECCTVGPREAVAPLYVMAPDYPQRLQIDLCEFAPDAIGTVAMTADNWRRIQYDERCVGYGGDDACIAVDCRLARLHLDRTQPVYHIAHDAIAIQKEFYGRSDHWNRAEFNPENFAANRKWLEERVKPKPAGEVPP